MNEENEWGLRPLTPSETDRLRELAEAVGEDLGQFGLTLYNREAPDWETAAGGLEIEVDAFDDAAGGIWLHWTVHPALRRASLEAHQSGRPNDSVIRAAGHVHERMASAILSMLKALGYVAENSNDDYRPFAIKVLSGPR
ncbi:hypothetical protein OG539_13670 [Actinacidiphila glaucinigra]|uniref:hypothetical protein n=1 Tax=Actinacidiphila glaucinigra TaxID=235986 RepID=UPI002DDB8754|nr:hypothetical protein [Actinacidiphila glaucinigra]WSD62650.1 hypothetical protein OIE69_29045 [Actinacidiphila glaucinigra]